jgi:hypothetical protein
VAVLRIPPPPLFGVGVLLVLIRRCFCIDLDLNEAFLRLVSGLES